MYGTFYSYVEFGLINIRFYTNQSNLLVFIVTFLMVFGWDKSKFFKHIALIATLDIILTGLVYNILLTDLVVGFTETQLFLMLITHTVVPILYTLLYLVYVIDSPQFKTFYITLIHPFLYFVVFQIIGAFNGYYPYPFLNPNQGLVRFLITNLAILLPGLFIFTFILIWTKQKLQKVLDLKV
jgi:hypothetical protein